METSNQIKPWQVVAVVTLWWVANTIATIASKNVMVEGDISAQDTADWTSAFQDLRWVDLAVFQQLLGLALMVIWLKLSKGKPIMSTEVFTQTWQTASIAAFGNIIGNLANNAAYSLITSSTTQVVKTYEPLFTFVLALFLYKDYRALNISTLLSVLMIVIGAATFAMNDATFNIWGLVAGMVSNAALPIRNIFMKTLGNTDTPLQKYVVIYTHSVLLLLPVLLAKVVFTRELFTDKLSVILTSGVSHCTYHLASFTVLEYFSPLTHAVLNISKRMFVIAANIAYFHIPLSSAALVSLLVLMAGCYLYKLHTLAKHRWNIVKIAILWLYLAYLLTSPGYLMQTPTSTHQNLAYTCLPPDIRITTAWVFEKQMPDSIVRNIQTLSKQNPNVPVHVYCGTTQCLRVITDLDSKSISTEFLDISKLVRNTTLEYWFVRHTLNKVLAGIEYEDHLHQVVRLGILWNHGGVYVNPTVRVTGDLTFPKCGAVTSVWVSKVVEVPGRAPIGFLDASYFPRNHPFIAKLAKIFVSEYHESTTTKGIINFSFQRAAQLEVFKSTRENTPNINYDLHLESVQVKSTSPNHYGTLAFNVQPPGAEFVNVGDEIQSLPGLQYLPFVDKFIERDGLQSSKGPDKITAFLNACWFGPAITSWPPPANIDPILISICSAITDKFAKSPQYLRQYEPIGCQDYGCLNFMKELGVKAYFSGCPTLLLKNPNVGQNCSDNIYIVDVKEDLQELLPPVIREKGIRVTHHMENKQTPYANFVAAYERLEMYGRAKLVITQRMQCALPSVGMGTPVIFINSPETLGDEALKEKPTPQVVGLTPLFHTLDMYAMSEEKAKEWLQNFPWDNAPPNPNINLLMRLRATAWNVIRKRQPLYDSARKFGLVPMSVPPHRQDTHQLIFHLIFTTSISNVHKLCSGNEIQGFFNWRHRRAIESIFHHHATAKVIVHSNTLSQTEFDVFTEAGYSIEVRSYNLERLLQRSRAHAFVDRLEEARKGEYWYSHETDLLRLVVLYLSGGVYMDTDMILVRPIDSLRMNTLGWQDSRNISLNGAFMMFEKGNLFLKACLEEFAEHYVSAQWATNGPDLLTRVWRPWNGRSSEVHVMHHNAFYMFHYSNVTEQCFKLTSGAIFNTYTQVLGKSAYAVHLNSKITGNEGIGKNQLKQGTICSRLLNSYCVLCNEMY